jgi:DNA-binding response OmpR family regulator
VVEDDPKLGALMVRTLARAGWECTTASTGDQALRSVLHDPPTAIVLDVMIPHPSGIEVCRHLRAHGWRGTIVVISARCGPADVAAAYRAGADCFLGKPFHMSSLVDAVHDAGCAR